MNETPEQLTTAAALESACQGLLYPSESDAPFTVFTWPAATTLAAEALAANVATAGRKTAEVSLHQFFSELADSDDADRFEGLHALLKQKLADVDVFRVGEGETKIDIYVVGRVAIGGWVGLHTTSVET